MPAVQRCLHSRWRYVSDAKLLMKCICMLRGVGEFFVWSVTRSSCILLSFSRFSCVSAYGFALKRAFESPSPGSHQPRSVYFFFDTSCRLATLTRTCHWPSIWRPLRQVRAPGGGAALRLHDARVLPVRAARQDHALLGGVLQLLHLRRGLHVRHRVRRVLHIQGEASAVTVRLSLLAVNFVEWSYCGKLLTSSRTRLELRNRTLSFFIASWWSLLYPLCKLCESLPPALNRGLLPSDTGAVDKTQDDVCRVPGAELWPGVRRALQTAAALGELRDAAAVAEAARRAAARPAQLHRHDQIHLQPRQPEAHDEHAEGALQEHPVRGLPRVQGEIEDVQLPSPLSMDCCVGK